MIDDLKLPPPEAMPETRPYPFTLEQYDRWVNDQHGRLRREGRLERILNQPTRQPVAEPFRLV